MSKIAARQIKSAAPNAVGSTNSGGTSDSVSLADHVHAHGQHTDPLAHHKATSSANGFMSSTDKVDHDAMKAKLDGIPANADSTAALAATVAPQYTTSTVNVAGSSPRWAREDHRHGHANQPGGLLHAEASGSAAGFQSVGHYNKVEKIDNAAAAITLGPVTAAALFTAPVPLTVSGATNLATNTNNDWAIDLTGNATLTLTGLAAGRQGNIWVRQGGGFTLSFAATGATILINRGTLGLDVDPNAGVVTHYSYGGVTLNGTLYVIIYRTVLITL